MTDEYLREYQFPITTAGTPFLSAAETMTPTVGTPAEKNKTTATNVAENAAEHGAKQGAKHGATRAATARRAETDGPHIEMNAVNHSAKKGAECAAPDSAGRTAESGENQGARSAAARIAEAQKEITTAGAKLQTMATDATDAVVKTRANAGRTKGARKKAEKKRTATIPPLPPAGTGS